MTIEEVKAERAAKAKHEGNVQRAITLRRTQSQRIPATHERLRGKLAHRATFGQGTRAKVAFERMVHNATTQTVCDLQPNAKGQGYYVEPR